MRRVGTLFTPPSAFRASKNGQTIILKATTGTPEVDEDELGDRDTVTWSSVEYLCNEGDGVVTTKILRWGKLFTPVVVEYKLINLNLMPDAFEEHSGKVVMVRKKL